jgi:ATP-dependent Lhr-like helicase
LVFANSRKRTESIAATLSDMCEEQIVPNEFFPTMVPCQGIT